MKLKGYTRAQVNALPGKVHIRKRKTSGTWAIYLKSAIIGEDFPSLSAAEQELETSFPELFNRYFIACYV